MVPRTVSIALDAQQELAFRSCQPVTIVMNQLGTHAPALHCACSGTKSCILWTSRVHSTSALCYTWKLRTTHTRPVCVLVTQSLNYTHKVCTTLTSSVLCPPAHPSSVLCAPTHTNSVLCTRTHTSSADDLHADALVFIMENEVPTSVIYGN